MNVLLPLFMAFVLTSTASSCLDAIPARWRGHVRIAVQSVAFLLLLIGASEYFREVRRGP